MTQMHLKLKSKPKPDHDAERFRVTLIDLTVAAVKRQALQYIQRQHPDAKLTTLTKAIKHADKVNGTITKYVISEEPDWQPIWAGENNKPVENTPASK